MRCKKCGESLREGANFCPVCGQRVSMRDSENSGRLKIIISLIVAGAVLAAFLWIIGRSPSGPGTRPTPTPSQLQGTQSPSLSPDGTYAPSGAPTSEEPVASPPAVTAPPTPSPTPTAAEWSNIPQADKISTIREWYYATRDKLAQYESSKFSSGTAYRNDGALEAIESSDNSENQWFYFRDGRLYFAYYHNPDTGAELRLYFWNDKLIRCVDGTGVTHDNETSHTNWTSWESSGRSRANSLIDAATR